jgi:hypothetical protein
MYSVGNDRDSGTYISSQILPLDLALIPPKRARLFANVLQRQKHRRLRALVNRLRAVAFGHVRVHIPRTAAVHQYFTAAILNLFRQHSRPSNQSGFTRRVCRAQEAFFLLLAGFDGRLKVAHNGCDIVFSFRGEEPVADG